MRCAAVSMLLLAGLIGCDDDETSTIDVGPTGPPSVRFADPASGAGPVCVSIGDDATTRVPLLLATGELLLHPPGTCGNFAQCGYLTLYADDVRNNEGPVQALDLLLYKLGDRYHDGSISEATGEPDYLQLRVEVLDDESEPLLDHDELPLADTIELITVPDCDAR